MLAVRVIRLPFHRVSVVLTDMTSVWSLLLTFCPFGNLLLPARLSEPDRAARLGCSHCSGTDGINTVKAKKRDN